MNLKKVLIFGLLAIVGVSYGIAGNVDAEAARIAAGKFLQGNRTRFHSRSLSDIKLAHTEASSVKGNAYYVFNIEGGGWIIMAGDDCSKPVLAYGDYGNIDMSNMPENMRGYLNMLKGQIETAQAYKGETVPVKAFKNRTVVEPLLKTDWSQGEPMNRLCPVNGSGEITSVGCGPLAMAQILYYWKYPSEVGDLPGYQGTGYQWYSGLEGTTFDYSKMLDNYYTHNPETGNPTGYVAYTEEQANEVAKLCRYCGQGCKVRYGNANGTSSGSYTYDQRDAFKLFGYNENMQLIGKDPAYYCSNNNKYTIEEWCALICTELEAKRPIPYHDVYEGHAWVLDGVDAEGRFHMNWGFNGRFNGWFEINALSFHPYGDDEVWDFSSGSNGGNEMIIGMYPYDGYVIPGDDEPEVMRGDVNGNGIVDVLDATALINYLLYGDSTGLNLDNANCDGEEGVDITDATALINFLLYDVWDN
ncbi:MAG: C10 family peptidase [Muribaculaceae bacterium]|nr:C10 family peptidase [Muribaculaceae bacterium]